MTDAPLIDAKIANSVYGRDDVAMIVLTPARPFHWRAGQYLSISIGGLNPRFYSIANMPDGTHPRPEVHVRRAGTGGLSDYLVEKARPGDIVQISGPFGDLGIIEHEKRPLLLVAGGLGIVPLRALAEHAMQSGHPEPVTLVWGTNYHHDQYLAPLFEHWALRHESFSFVPVTGTYVSQRVGELFDDVSSHRVFLGGPPDMLLATKLLLKDKGVDEQFIHHDPLPTSSKLKVLL